MGDFKRLNFKDSDVARFQDNVSDWARGVSMSLMSLREITDANPKAALKSTGPQLEERVRILEEELRKLKEERNA